MNEKICLVTGANSGIGKVAAKALAAGGATVIMVCRNRDKGEAARDEIVRERRNEKVSLLNNAGSYNGVQSGCNVICRLGCAPAQAKRK